MLKLTEKCSSIVTPNIELRATYLDDKLKHIGHLLVAFLLA